MPLETFGYIDSLNANNPAISDGLVNGDDHIRGIKAVLKATFPGAAGPITYNSGSGTYQFIPGDNPAGYPAYSFYSERTLGFYHLGTKQIGIAGGTLRGPGAVPVGAVVMFLGPPAGLGTDWLELNGNTYSNASFPDLAAHLNQGGSSFTLKAMTDTGRFPRSRTGALAVGTAQSSVFAAHTHGVSGTTNTENVDHSHTFSGTTANENQIHQHTYSAPIGSSLVNLQGGSTYGNVYVNTSPSGSFTTGSENANHNHNFSGTTNTASAHHAHTFSVTSASAGSGSETRPEALSFYFCIKT